MRFQVATPAEIADQRYHSDLDRQTSPKAPTGAKGEFLALANRPAAITVTIAPALDKDGRRAYSTRGPFFVGMVDGRRIIERSPQPFVDAARELLSEGIDPGTVLVMRYAGRTDDALKSTVGAAAKLTVLDTAQGKPVFRPWRPSPAIAGGPPVSGTAGIARLGREASP
jgi:hypothetical protein